MRAVLLLIALTGCATLRDKGERLPSGITASAGTPRRFALLVGIDSFADERFTPLRWAGADARELGEALSGFDEVRVLTGPEATLRANVVHALHELGERASNPRDTLVVYVSSHGSLGRFAGGPVQRFIVTQDTRLDVLAETAMSIDALKHELESFPARRKALILALCHSGKGKSAVPDSLLAQLRVEKQAPPLHELSEGMVVMTACAFGETARESDSLGHDVYTAGLLSALRHGDRDGDGAVTALEAHDFARESTWTSTDGQQRPTLEAELVGRDPIVLSGEVVRTPAPVVQSYASAAEGLQLRVDGQVKGRLPGGIGVEPGPHHLVVENGFDGRVLFETDIDVKPGERLDVSDVLPRPARWELSAGALLEATLVAPVVEQVWPLAGGVTVGFARAGDRLTLRASASYATGTGRIPGIEETLAFRAHLLRLEATLLWRPSPRLPLQLGGELGWLLAVREVTAPGFVATQAAGGPLLQLRVEWMQPVSALISLGGALRGGAVVLDVVGAAPLSPLVGGEVAVSFGW